MSPGKKKGLGRGLSALFGDEKPKETLEKIIAIMKKAPTWCKELPLDAEGYYNKFYTK